MISETPSTPSTESEEQIHKVYVKELKEKDAVHSVFRVAKKARHTGRSGKSFLALALQDRTGEVDARIFDNVDAAEGAFVDGDFLLLTGQVITFQGRKQVVIDRLEKLDPTPLDLSEFTPVPPKPVEAPRPTRGEERPTPRKEEAVSRATLQHVAHIRESVSRISDPHVKALLMAFLEDPAVEEGLKVSPAAKGIHHAYRGGLAEHIDSVMRLSQRVADHYPMADRDLLLAGAFLHDIMKVKEISPEKGFEYSDEGRLVGHLVMTAQAIREKAGRIDGFPQLLEQHLTHLVLAHHGQLEWGSPKVPMTLEAMLVHYIDTIDSRVASWLEHMQRDPHAKWTEPSRAVDRPLWKAPLPTVKNRAPVPPRGGKPKGEREQPKGRSGEQVRKEKEVPGGIPKDLTFKPFSELVPEAPTESPMAEQESPESPQPSVPEDASSS